MCSPELTRGTCCICFGTLLPETALYEDCGEGRGGVHRGVCAILGGYYPSDELAYIGGMLIHFRHRATTQKERDEATNAYYGWVHSVADEHHYSDF
jgi:hypothetical protein